MGSPPNLDYAFYISYDMFLDSIGRLPCIMDLHDGLEKRGTAGPVPVDDLLDSLAA